VTVPARPRFREGESRRNASAAAGFTKKERSPGNEDHGRRRREADAEGAAPDAARSRRRTGGGHGKARIAARPRSFSAENPLSRSGGVWDFATVRRGGPAPTPGRIREKNRQPFSCPSGENRPMRELSAGKKDIHVEF